MTTSKLYDITEVCQLLTTSRTLRFYEEKGIITSTTLGTSTRRQYTQEQFNHIRNILVLRTLGLSIKSITHFSDKLKAYLPLDAYQRLYTDTLIPLGNFVALEKSEIDSQNSNVIFHYVRYEKPGLRIQYIFHNNQIHGLWFRYY